MRPFRTSAKSGRSCPAGHTFRQATYEDVTIPAMPSFTVNGCDMNSLIYTGQKKSVWTITTAPDQRTQQRAAERSHSHRLLSQSHLKQGYIKLRVRIFGLPRRVRRIGVQVMRFMKLIAVALFFSIVFTLPSQKPDGQFVLLDEGGPFKAVKSKANVVTKIVGDVRSGRGYFGAEHWMKKKIPYETWDQITRAVYERRH